MNLNQYIGKGQLAAIRETCKGEEGEYFKAKIITLKEAIANMPKTYETENDGDSALAWLHYFKGGSDWYIIEKDAGSSEDEKPGIQTQAFGFTCLNGDYENAELGYINIQELIENGIELDLYYCPETLQAIKDRYSDRGKIKTNLDVWFEEGTCPAEGCPENCYVELDGRCSHGFTSVVMNMGMI